MPDASGAGPFFSPVARANGVDLAYQTFGCRSDAPLLLIAGLGAQMTAWDDAFCDRLAARGLYVVRFDNRDSGRSTWFTHASTPGRLALVAAALHGRRVSVAYSIEDMARDCVGLLDALALPRAHVVGASLGSAIGQSLAIHHPERVASFTSIMGMSGNPRLLRPRPDALALLFARAATSEAAYIAACRHACRVLRAGAFPDEEARDTNRARIAWLRGHNPAGRARQFAAFLAGGSRAAALRDVQVPTLVVHGALDPLVPLAAGMETASLIPHARLRVIERMGHTIPTPLWDEVLDAIGEHVSGSTERRGGYDVAPSSIRTPSLIHA
jgi:pimeloyl-ACP methyl ester carboxylesterase